MARTYLFYDIECANCFNGVGKICSFGYVLTDSSFNVIESDDIVINPDCQFDWFLFSKKAGAKLAYPKEYFYSQPQFPEFYERIKNLLTAEERSNFIFGSIDDIGFVVTAVERYKLNWFDFKACNLEKIIKIENEISGKLEQRCQTLNIDTSDLLAHKSSDDAIMTMRLLKAWCELKKITPEEVSSINKDCIFSANDFLEVRERRLKKKAKLQARKERMKKNQNAESKKAGAHKF